MKKDTDDNKSVSKEEMQKKPSGKRFRGGKSKSRKFNTKSGDKSSYTNDPAWYSQSPDLLRNSASIPFSWPVGSPLRSNGKLALDVVPGICAVKVLPTVGTSLNSESPVNVAASAIYSWVRHANSGHSNYDSPDLMMYMLAMSNVYSFVTWMQRVYAYASVYDQRNRYLPRAVLEADGVDFDSVRDNLANFRYYLNAYVNKVASLAVPATMPIFSRLAFLYSNVYIEGPSIKDQLYMYSPSNLTWYQFGLNGSTGAGELTLTAMSVANTLATVEEIMAYGNQLFNAIWDQEDFGIMSGDILKAYDGNVIKLAAVPEVLPIAPVYDAMVLHQIKNAKIASFVAIGKISQNNGIISHSLTISSTAAGGSKNAQANLAVADKILTTDFDDPGPDVVIESTRLMIAYDSYAGVFYAGTEIVRSVNYIYYDNAGVLQTHVEYTDTHIYYESIGADATYLANMLTCSQNIANFKYHPEKYYFSMDDNAQIKKVFRLWDIDNYAVLSNEDLIKMHESALLSLFAVPAIAKIS